MPPASSLATPCRTVITKVGARKTLISPNSTSSAVIVVPRGPQDDQAHVTLVLLDLGPHMEALRVLHRQFVQPEGLTDLVQLVHPRFEQPEPHESVLAALGRGLLQRDRPLFLPAAILVVSTINDHREDSFAMR